MQAAAAADEYASVKTIRAVLTQPESDIDLSRAKLKFDALVDPSIDIEASLSDVDNMAATVRRMAGPDAADIQLVETLKTYIYEAGDWNNNRAYQYDFDDPLGTKLSNKLLPNYMASGKGNCITMPFLFIVLADRLGLDATASTAPLHVFVKFSDSDTGQTFNLETTSGANPTRDEWCRQKMPMTDQAVANRVYLATLTRKETVAVMADVVTEHLIEQGRYREAIAVSDEILEYYPTHVYAILKKGSASYKLLRASYMQKYPNPNLIPPAERPFFEFLSATNMQAFAKAEALGWREPGREHDEDYLRRVNQAAGQAQ